MRFILFLILLVSSCKSNSQCSLNQAKKEMTSGNLSAAISCYEQHLNSSDSLFVFEQLSFCYAEKNEFEMAINFGERAISANSANLNLLMELGNWHYLTNQGDRALNYFLMIERRDSVFQKINYNIALTYLTELDAPLLAKKYIERELEYYENDAENLALAGQIELQLDSLSNSILYFSQAIKINSQEAKYYLLRAIAYYYADEEGLTLLNLNKALELDSNFVDAKLLKLEIGVKYGLPFVCSLSNELYRSGDLSPEYSYLIEKCKME